MESELFDCNETSFHSVLLVSSAYTKITFLDSVAVTLNSAAFLASSHLHHGKAPSGHLSCTCLNFL
jgi:hypothetical protein